MLYSNFPSLSPSHHLRKPFDLITLVSTSLATTELAPLTHVLSPAALQLPQALRRINSIPSPACLIRK